MFCYSNFDYLADCLRVQCDEIWSFVHAKAKNAPKNSRAGDPTIGDCWTWTAIDADSKLC